MNRFAASIVTAAVLGISSGAAHAVSVGMNVYNTDNAGSANIAAAAINLDVADTGSEYSFTFTNGSTILSSIIKLYFDNALASVLAGSPTMTNSAGVDFRPATVVSDPPASADIGWTGSLAMLRVVGTDDATKIDNGIANGGAESLTINFAKVGGTLLQDVVDLLTTTGGIVAHLVDLEGNGLRTNINLTTYAGQIPAGEDEDDPIVSVPTPASAAAGIALMGLLAARRRRRDA